MVQIRPIEAGRTIDIGGVPDTRVDNSIGQGLAQVGNAISNHADMQNQMALRRQQMEQQVDDFATNQAFQRWQDDNALDFAKQQEGMAPSGKGFTDNVSGIYTKRSEEFLKSVPDSLKPKFAELVSTARNQWIDKGAAAEIDQRNNWYRTSITERQQTLQNQVFNDPTMFDAAKQDAHRTIDASGLSPTEKEKLKKQADEMFSLTIGEREVREAQANPASITDAADRLGVPAVGSDAIGVVVGKIIGVESGGNAKAKNPNSSAAGLGQFIDSTWLNMVRKYRPDIAGGKSNAELIALKTNPQLSREMTTAYTRENAQFLANQGIQQTPGNIYLAHFLGPRGAAQVLKADPNASIESIVGPAVVQANGFLRGKSAGDVAAWSAGKMGGKASSAGQTPADPRFANLSLSQRLSLYDQMNAAAQRGQTAIDAQNNAAYDSKNSSLLLGIQENKITSTEQIYAAGLKDSDTLAALKALESRQKDNILTADAVAAFQSGTLKVDPYSSDDRKKVDAIGKMIETVVPEDQRQANVEKLVSQTGSVPETYFNKIRAGLDSQIPNDFGQAMEMAYRLNQANPIAFGRSAGGDAIQKKVNDYDYMINKLAMKPEDAWKRLAEENNPDKIRDRKALEPLEKQFVKDLTDGDLNKQVVQIFDEWWTSDPQVGFGNQMSVAIQSDYLEAARREFVRNGGNADRAKYNASKQMKDLYGVTQITGSKVIMRNPPDKYWPHVPNVSDPMGYVKTQLIDELKAAFPDDKTLNSREDPNGITMTINGISFDKNDVATRRAMESRFRDDAINRVRLTPLPSTQQEIDAKKMPGYMVSYVDEKGNEQVLNNARPWRPDFTTALNAQREEQAERQAVAASVGRQTRAIAEDQMIMRQMEDGGREATLDAFIAGPASTPQTIANPNPGFSAPVPQSANPSVQGNLKQQRTQLFQNAKESGMLNGDQ